MVEQPDPVLDHRRSSSSGALRKRVNVYEAFIEGAKGGIQTSLTIIPYLVGMLVAISVMRNSGVLGFIVERLRMGVHRSSASTPTSSPALPTALMKPLSRQRLARA